MRSSINSAMMILFLALALPALDAQDSKDEPGKSGDAKKTDTKTEAKKKAPTRVDEAVVLGSQVIRAKIRDILADENAKEIIVSAINPQKLQDYIEWETKLREQMPRVINLDENQKKEYFKKETTAKYDLIFDGESKSILITPEIRVRTTDPPKLYDAAGNPRKVSPAELPKLRGVTRLPGYTGEFGSLHTGQVVDVYVPKTANAAPKQVAPVKKKDFVGNDPALTVKAPAKMNAYMVLVVQD